MSEYIEEMKGYVESLENTNKIQNIDLRMIELEVAAIEQKRDLVRENVNLNKVCRTNALERLTKAMREEDAKE